MNANQKTPHRLLDRAIEVMAIVGFTGLVIIAFMTLIDVFLRYLGYQRVSGLNDIEEVAFAIVIASCFPAGLRKGNAVTVRILGKLLGQKFHGWFDTIGSFFTLFFFSVVSWQFFIFTIDCFNAGRTTSTLELPVWPVWSTVSIIMFSCVGVQILMLYHSVSLALKGKILDYNNPNF